VFLKTKKFNATVQSSFFFLGEDDLTRIKMQVSKQHGRKRNAKKKNASKRLSLKAFFMRRNF